MMLSEAEKDMQYMYDKIARIDPDYFIKSADEVITFINKLKAKANEIKRDQARADAKDKFEFFANPADYLPAMRVGDAYEKQTVYEDIDGDGDVDKIEIDEES